MLCLQSKITQSKMVVGTSSQRPVIEAFRFADPQIVDGCVTMMHNSFGIELPVFIPVGAIPLARIILTLIGKSRSDPIITEGPELLDESVLRFAFPFCASTNSQFHRARWRTPTDFAIHSQGYMRAPPSEEYGCSTNLRPCGPSERRSPCKWWNKF